MINHDPRKNKVKITHLKKKYNNTNKYHTRSQPHYYKTNYFSSAEEEYYNQNHQRFYSSQRPPSYSIDQPDTFKPYTRNEETRQLKNNPTSYKNNFQQQNPVNTQSYQLNA